MMALISTTTLLSAHAMSVRRRGQLMTQLTCIRAFAKNVTKGRITKAVAAGCDAIGGLKAKTKAGTGEYTLLITPMSTKGIEYSYLTHILEYRLRWMHAFGYQTLPDGDEEGRRHR